MFHNAITGDKKSGNERSKNNFSGKTGVDVNRKNGKKEKIGDEGEESAIEAGIIAEK
jgi:hypothetical protein